MIRKIILLLFVFLSMLWLRANPVTDLLKKSVGSEKYTDAKVLVIFDSTQVDVQESGLSYVYIHTLQKMLTQEGANQFNVVKIDYDPLSAYIEFKKVIIYRKTGEVDEIPVSGTLDYPAPARMIYWGSRQKMIGLGRLEPGDAVEIVLFRKGFTYALLQSQNEDEQYIPPMKGHFYDIVEFWNENPVLNKIYKVSLPKSKSLQYKFYNGEYQLDQSEVGDKHVFCFTVNKVAKTEHEDHSVVMSDVAPKLLLSTSSDWQAKSLWFYGVNEEYKSFASTPDIKEEVNRILKGAEDEMDSISRLTHWVADEIRYSGLSIGKGEGFTLHRGEMDYTDRCGVCKDKAGMLVTMLRAAGFQSYAAMTMAGSRIDRIPADQFNHSVTVVKLRNGKFKMLDPTWVPFLRELWSSREQQQNYLMGLPEGADLMEIPISDPENHYLRINITSKLNLDGSLSATLHLEAEGQSDASVRSIFTYSYKDQWRTNLEHVFLKINPLVRIDSLQFTDPYDYLKTPVKISAHITIPNYADKAGNALIFVPLSASNIFDYAQGHLNFDTTLVTRKFPFVDRCSRLVEISETLVLPENAEIINLPANLEHTGTSASFSISYNTSENQIKVAEKIRLSKRVYAVDEWSDFRNVVCNQLRYAKNPVVLKFK